MNIILAMEPGAIVGLVLAIVVVVGLAISGIKIVKQTEKYVIERVGKYHTILDPGVHWIWPFFDRVALRVVLKEQIRDFDPQPVITKDNVTMQIDTVVFFQITDPKLYAYGVVNPISKLIIRSGIN